MKKMILSAIVIATIVAACNNNQESKSTATTPDATNSSAQLYACSMHPEVTGKKDAECSKCGMKLTEPVKAVEENKTAIDTSTKTSTTTTAPTTTTPAATVATPSAFNTANIVTNYLALKNALTKDDTKATATAAKALYANIIGVDANAIDAAKKKEFMDIAESAKENAEHIGDNAGKLDHQREHFALLSKDVNDLVKIFGSKQKLYQDFCPMYDDGKGAIWISEFKEIKNPYFGSKMISCGSMKKEL